MFILHVYDSTVLLGGGGDGGGITLMQKGCRAGDCICISTFVRVEPPDMLK